ncbi:hypothetical protein WICPIJ_000132 [Wickerhamomyces pijperi]|uniref:Nucleoporin NUP188 n=1 Tax=Wickerhamomyces pijperi TaxID=599730 RepID=A0A9P8QHG7_WICPI|nr:hypothetical protein WICPIJ_000132 [Wickerhamomyces pijperi]
MTVAMSSSNDSDKWTFDLVLTLLQAKPDLNCLKSIDAFLEKNKPLLIKPFLFQQATKDGPPLPTKETLEIRATSYPINDQIKKDCDEISKQIYVDKLEVLRVIAQVSERHSSKISDGDDESSKQLSDHEKITKEEIHSLYINSVLRERSTIVKLIAFLVTRADVAELSSKYSNLMFNSPDFIPSIIAFLKQLITTDLMAIKAHSKYKHIIKTQTVCTIVELLKLLVSLCIKISVPVSIVKQWFELLQAVQAFNVLKDEIERESYQEITGLSSLVSMLALGLDTDEDFFDFNSSYLKDPEAVTLINNTIVDFPSDPVLLYCWSVLLGLLDDSVVSGVFGVGFKLDEYSSGFALRAAELDVFGYVESVSQSVSYDEVNSAILASFIIAISPFLQLNDAVSRAILTVFKEAPNSFIEKFFINANVQNMIYLAKVKFPELITPYLRILSINGTYAHSQLTEFDTYMTVLSSSSLNFEADLDTDTIVLKDGHYLKVPYEQSKDAAIYLPPSTRGKLMPTADQNLEAAIFKYKYDGWSLIGRILQNVALYGGQEEQELILVILELITNTIILTDTDTTSDIFAKLSVLIDDGDVVDLILKLFELSLHQAHTALLAQLTKLLTALLGTFPQIVWSHLVRSDLLERRGRGGLISHILGAVETVTGDYKFTIEVLRFFNELVNQSVSNDKDLNSYKLEVLPKFVVFANQVFESFIHWDYKHKGDKYVIGSLILDSYTKIVYAVYGVDPETRPNKKVTGVLAASAERVVSSFTSTSPDVRIIKPILNTLDSLAQFAAIDQYQFQKWVSASLEFTKLVVSVRSLNKFTPSTLEKCLFSKAPAFVSVYNQQCSLRALILQVLVQLVKSTWSSNETPSLLAHLGEFWTSTLVLALGSDLQFKHQDFTVRKMLYSFFSSVIEANQKGLAMILLSGTGPNNTKVGGSKPLLKILKENVGQLDQYPESLSVHLVDAIALALNSWSLQGEDDVTFAKILIKKLLVDSQEPQPTAASNEQIIESCYRYKLNSRVAEICALILFSSKKQTVTDEIIKELDPDRILQLAKPLYEKSHYRGTLHSNLNRNFEQKWPDLKLQQFQRSALSSITLYGEGSVYELRLLDEVLGKNTYWIGTELTEGYRSEVIAASLNLQLVSSQIDCAKSWGALLTVYAKNFKAKPSFTDIVCKMLQANIDEGVEIALLKDVYRVRVELAFFFLYSITNNGVIALAKADNKKILKLALHLLTSIDVNVLVNISAGNSTIYRPLLRIVTNCLNSARADTELVESLSGELLEFVEIVLAKGTPVLLDSIEPTTAQVEVASKLEDLTLLISIVHNLMATRPTSSFVHSVSVKLSGFNALRSILRLYSNSHLLKINGEYVLAEMILTYITELISTEAIADQLIQSGLFSTLIQSQLSATIQEGSVAVHTRPRLHNIWRNGLLSIVLILLSKFGLRVLPESSAFVNHFSKQFQTTIQTWTSQDSVIVSVPALEELEQIIMLEKALETLYYEFGQVGPTSQDVHTGIIPGLDTDKARVTLQGSLSHLLAHPKFLTSKVIPTSLEEQTLFEGDDKIRTKLVEKIVAQINDIIESLED